MSGGGSVEKMVEEDQTMDKTDDEKKTEKKKEDLSDPEFFSCVLQPSPADSDPEYVGIRRFLLHRKAQSGAVLRKDWRCNGKGYVGFRNYISRPENWESMHVPSHSSTPGQRVIYWLMHQWAMDIIFGSIISFV